MFVQLVHQCPMPMVPQVLEATQKITLSLLMRLKDSNGKQVAPMVL